MMLYKNRLGLAVLLLLSVLCSSVTPGNSRSREIDDRWKKMYKERLQIRKPHAEKPSAPKFLDSIQKQELENNVCRVSQIMLNAYKIFETERFDHFAKARAAFLETAGDNLSKKYLSFQIVSSTLDERYMEKKNTEWDTTSALFGKQELFYEHLIRDLKRRRIKSSLSQAEFANLMNLQKQFFFKLRKEYRRLYKVDLTNQEALIRDQYSHLGSIWKDYSSDSTAAAPPNFIKQYYEAFLENSDKEFFDYIKKGLLNDFNSNAEDVQEHFIHEVEFFDEEPSASASFDLYKEAADKIQKEICIDVHKDFITQKRYFQARDEVLRFPFWIQTLYEKILRMRGLRNAIESENHQALLKWRNQYLQWGTNLKLMAGRRIYPLELLSNVAPGDQPIRKDEYVNEDPRGRRWRRRAKNLNSKI